MLRRLHRPLHLQFRRSASVKAVLREHGIRFAFFYWLANEIIVCILTYFLHYGYFGKEDLLGFLEKLGVSKYIDLNKAENKSWTLFNGKLVVTARFLANFAAASAFMAVLTPVKLPILLGVYRYISKFAPKKAKKTIV